MGIRASHRFGQNEKHRRASRARSQKAQKDKAHRVFDRTQNKFQKDSRKDKGIAKKILIRVSKKWGRVEAGIVG